MLSFRISFRFLKSSFLQSVLITAGIAVGIATQIFVGSLITSLQANLIDTTVGSSPHIRLLPQDGETTLPGQLAMSAVKLDDRITTAIPLRSLSAIYGGSADSQPLAIKGGGDSDLDTIYHLSDKMVSGDFRLSDDEVVVGAAFAEDFGVTVGERIPLLLPDGRTITPEVSGVFDLGQSAANRSFAFLDPASAQEALGLDADEYTVIELQVSDVFASTDVAAKLEKELDVQAADWQVENESLLSGLSAQSGSSAMIQAFVLLAVLLGIASTLAISAVQKTRQIGILKAIGMSDAAAGRIFLWQAAQLGTGGVIGGIALGYLFVWLFQFIPVPFSISIDPAFVVLSAAIGLAVAIASAIIPARSTSRLDPIEVIQNG